MEEKNKSIIKEIIRFLIIGGLATAIDYFLSGVVLYAFEPSKYEHFYKVFLTTSEASNLATIMSTLIGALAGLIFSYVFSIIFVYIYKGNSKSTQGFLMFSLLSFVGLGINTLGMYLGYTLLGLNYWVVRIFFTLLVMCYNYISKKIIIFNKNKSKIDNE